MLSSAQVYVPQCGRGARLARRGAFLGWLSTVLCGLFVLTLIVCAPWASAHGYAGLARAIYDGFGHVCHQIPSRSFRLEGHPFAVCARCTGIYAGLAAGALFYPLLRPLASSASWQEAGTPRRIWLFIAITPITVDFALGFFGIWENTHLSRLLTGGFFGAVCAFFVVPALIETSRAGWPRLAQGLRQGRAETR